MVFISDLPCIDAKRLKIISLTAGVQKSKFRNQEEGTRYPLFAILKHTHSK